MALASYFVYKKVENPIRYSFLSGNNLLLLLMIVVAWLLHVFIEQLSFESITYKIALLLVFVNVLSVRSVYLIYKTFK
ncbi:MAG: hypothetical protein GKR88_06855 [Flavobacteriaceae bacterium]|nr:MAG: hypothetical protein GKR88_06855 [Flavobacteriaceae bacterium]